MKLLKLILLSCSKNWLLRNVQPSVLRQRICVTEFIPKRAYDKAVYLDNLEENGKTVGPLHGLPISMKEIMNMKGLTIKFSITSLVDNVSDHDPAVVTILGDYGAVFYQRTKQPQFLMEDECTSNIYDTTINLYNTLLTCGGSSGGKGASGGFHSLCVDIGPCIGGTVRVPVGFQELYGFKSTVSRISIYDCFCTMPGAKAIRVITGPTGRMLKITKLVARLFIDANPWTMRRELSVIP